MRILKQNPCIDIFHQSMIYFMPVHSKVIFDQRERERERARESESESEGDL